MSIFIEIARDGTINIPPKAYDIYPKLSVSVQNDKVVVSGMIAPATIRFAGDSVFWCEGTSVGGKVKTDKRYRDVDDHLSEFLSYQDSIVTFAGKSDPSKPLWVYDFIPNTYRHIDVSSVHKYKKGEINDDALLNKLRNYSILCGETPKDNIDEYVDIDNIDTNNDATKIANQAQIGLPYMSTHNRFGVVAPSESEKFSQALVSKHNGALLVRNTYTYEMINNDAYTRLLADKMRSGKTLDEAIHECFWEAFSFDDVAMLSDPEGYVTLSLRGDDTVVYLWRGENPELLYAIGSELAKKRTIKQLYTVQPYGGWDSRNSTLSLTVHTVAPLFLGAVSIIRPSHVRLEFRNNMPGIPVADIIIKTFSDFDKDAHAIDLIVPNDRDFGDDEKIAIFLNCPAIRNVSIEQRLHPSNVFTYSDGHAVVYDDMYDLIARDERITSVEIIKRYPENKTLKKDFDALGITSWKYGNIDNGTYIVPEDFSSDVLDDIVRSITNDIVHRVDVTNVDQNAVDAIAKELSSLGIKIDLIGGSSVYDGSNEVGALLPLEDIAVNGVNGTDFESVSLALQSETINVTCGDYALYDPTSIDTTTAFLLSVKNEVEKKNMPAEFSRLYISKILGKIRDYGMKSQSISLEGRETHPFFVYDNGSLKDAVHVNTTVSFSVSDHIVSGVTIDSEIVVEGSGCAFTYKDGSLDNASVPSDIEILYDGSYVAGMNKINDDGSKEVLLGSPSGFAYPGGFERVEYTVSKLGDGTLEVSYRAFDASGNDITDRIVTVTHDDYFLLKEETI